MRLKISYLLVSLIACCALNIHAAPPSVGKSVANPTPGAGNSAAIGGGVVEGHIGSIGDLLREAYQDLDRADHDYSGHRIRAMHQIADAAKALGEKLSGDGKGGEKQGVSDEQLRAAEGLLQQARALAAGKPLKHINNALNQLSIALKLK